MSAVHRKLIEAISNNAARILALLDKSVLSPTFGSFDRKYWHYKILDFPCGMQQELVRPLGYVWVNDFQGNRFYKNGRIKEYIEAAFKYHRRSGHKDGSLDDYFPHERAFGATAYALAALTETALETGLCPSEVFPSFETSAAFLAEYREAGKLSNHLAIAACALTNLHALTGNRRWKDESERLLSELYSVQRSEGWFPEYEGCDLGYQTVTIEFLARRHMRAPDSKLFESIRRCIVFVRAHVHPDGSLGGEYCSRNTYNFYPGGFALMSLSIPEAAETYGLFFKGLTDGACNYLEDDGVFGHMLSSYVTALKAPDALFHAPASEYRKEPVLNNWAESGFFTGGTGTLEIAGSGSKGGVYKIFREGRLIWSDTGFAGRLAGGAAFFQNKPNIATASFTKNSVTISGRLQKFASKRLTRFQMIALRLFSLFFGRFRLASNAIRFIMQKMLIYNRADIPLLFTREIRLEPGQISIKDTLSSEGDHSGIEVLYRSTDCVNMHVITSDSFQNANLFAWEKLVPPPPGENASFEKIFLEEKRT